MKTKFKLSKRFLSILLAVVMVVGMLPFSALTAYAATEVPELDSRRSFTYSDGVTLYFKYNNYLYKATFTNMKDVTTFAVDILRDELKLYWTTSDY